jgi:hypothetical protein
MVGRYAIQFCKVIDSDNYARLNLEDVPDRADTESEVASEDSYLSDFA